MNTYKLHIASQQRYSCVLCGRCCRRFQVQLDMSERCRIASLDMGDDCPRDFTVSFQGNEFFRRKADGGCIFLDDHGACLIHSRHGLKVKALTCRGYPMNIVQTFPGELSVMARMDCPAVLGNHGVLLTDQKQEIESLITEMTFGRPFSASQCCELSRTTIDHIRDAIVQLIDSDQSPLPNRIRSSLDFLEALQRLGTDFLNDDRTMEEIWPSLRSRFSPAENIPNCKPLSAYSRLIFRTWLQPYCRRDEELLDRSFSTRLHRFVSNVRFIFGYGNWHDLGAEHPDFSFSQADIFGNHDVSLNHDIDIKQTWAPFVQFLKTRLECYQFLGNAYYGTDFFTGMKALLKSYAITLALARFHASASSRSFILHDDVFYAVLALDHCHGHSPMLKLSSARHNEAFFSHSRFDSLLASLGWQ